MSIRLDPYEKSLSRDRTAYCLYQGATDSFIYQIVRKHPLAPKLCRFASGLEAAVADRRHQSFPHARMRMIDPIVDKLLNLFYRCVKVRSSPNITLLTADLGGFGDHITQVRTLRGLQHDEMPGARFSLITGDRKKLTSLLVDSPVSCSVSDYHRMGI